MQFPFAVGIPEQRLFRAVVLDQRVQHAALGAVLLHGQHETVEHGESVQPASGLVRSQDLVHARVQIIEDRQVEKHREVLFRQIPQQPHADEVGGDGFVAGDDQPGLDRAHGAADAQRHGPPARPLQDRRKVPPRQLAAEELRHLVPREPQVVRANEFRLPREDGGTQVQPRIGPHRQPDAKTRGGGPQQQFEKGDRLVRQPLHIVQHQQAGRRVSFYRVRQQRDRLWRSAPRGGVRRRRQLESRAFEGVGEIGRQTVRLVVDVHRHPRGEDSALPLAPDDIGQQGRLAEPARRSQHREAPLHKHLLNPPLERGAVKIAVDRSRRRGLGLQQHDR